MEKAFINWSGGKDCTLALHHVLKEKTYDIASLFTTIATPQNRVSMHGVRKELITRQGFSLNIRSRKMYLPESTDHALYNKMMLHEMKLMAEKNIRHAIFGDIFLEDLKTYREEKLKEAGINGVFPLWKKNTTEVLKEFIGLGYKAIVVCTDADLIGPSFCGRTLDENFINDLPKNADPCGENGEFHTFVYDGPIFSEPIKFVMGEMVLRSYKTEDPTVRSKSFHFLDLLPV